LGLPARTRRTAGAGGEGRRVDRVGDPQGRRDRPGTRTSLHHVGRLPACPHPVRGAHVRTGGDRAPHPPDPHPGCDRAPDRILGGAGRQEPGHGPGRRRMPGTVHDPRPRRQVPCTLRRRPGRCGHQGRADRSPDAENETSGCILHLFGTMGG
jgi:hypothetical protein